LAIACIAWLGVATGATAEMVNVLQISQSSGSDFVTATESGGTTVLTTSSVSAPNPTSIPVQISTILGAPVSPTLAAWETFGSTTALTPGTGLTSTGPAVTVSGALIQPFSGVIAITSGPEGTGTNFLTAQFTDTFMGTLGANSAGLTASVPPESVVFTSGVPVIQAFLAANPNQNLSLGFSGLTPAVAETSGSLASFQAQNVATFSASPAVVPEPATLGAASLGILASLGYGWRRRRAVNA
jgi:hypothetical protein